MNTFMWVLCTLADCLNTEEEISFTFSFERIVEKICLKGKIERVCLKTNQILRFLNKVHFYSI